MELLFYIVVYKGGNIAIGKAVLRVFSVRLCKIYKKSILVLFLSMLLQCKCGPTRPDSNNEIFGSWNWEWSYGGLAGEYIFADSVDYYKSLIIDRNMTLIEMHMDSVVYSSSITVEKRIIGNADTADVIIVEDHPMFPSPFWLIIDHASRDSLILTDYCLDCYTHKYIRMFPIM